MKWRKKNPYPRGSLAWEREEQLRDFFESRESNHPSWVRAYFWALAVLLFVPTFCILLPFAMWGVSILWVLIGSIGGCAILALIITIKSIPRSDHRGAANNG